MTAVDPIPAGYHTITPHIVVKGAAEALAFYAEAFGAEELCRMPAPDGRLMHAEIRIGDAVVFLCDDFPDYGGIERNPLARGGATCTLNVHTADCDAAIQRALDAGATLAMPAADMFWGDRYGKVTDPFGHEWAFSQRIAVLSPEEMAEAARNAFGSPGDSE